ncbi:hypothetical protein [Hoyosella sp. YIM 151337]|uniref:hypothetical protein n=1 Tax=Hoyosella sp. YIM 151337 TaxID=2992742 RepID=UPI00223669FF|nr:hypothetical protein [Hoyosella sp. YIM 151337]
MSISIPSRQPNYRFMGYVRPPVKVSEEAPPLFPLRPATRGLRLGIDVTTMPTPQDGLVSRFLGREEIDVHLMVSPDDSAPAAWIEAIGDPLIHQIGFTSIETAKRWLDTVQFGVTTTGKQKSRRTNVRFFDGYQHLDERAAPPNPAPLTISQRHRAAAYAAAAAAVGIDAIVTTAPTAGRSDVADNDLVASVTPDGAVALIGHYLRMTANPDIDVQRGSLVGGGTFEMTESAATIENFYAWGVVSGMTYFDCLPMIAASQGDVETVTAVESIHVRLMRAARALDDMLAALSNPVRGKRRLDVVETAAEAFDRQLLYLAAAFDIFGRRYPLLIDPARNPRNFRHSLDGKGYIKGHLEKQYDSETLAGVKRLHVYAGVCKVLRNHIHHGILPIDHYPGRGYGNRVSIALNVDAMPELMPEADERMTPEHYDSLGVWRTHPRAVVGGDPATVADLATAGFTLMGAGVALVEEFTKLILLNKPQNSVTATSPILGCIQAQPGKAVPELPERAELYQALFGWHSA